MAPVPFDVGNLSGYLPIIPTNGAADYTSMSTVLEVRHLSRTVDGKRLLDDVSLSIEHGEIFVIVGPSGAGKSTLLRLLNRLDEPTDGTVFYRGTDYTTIPPRELRMSIGFIPHDPALVKGTVEENVARGPILRGERVDTERVSWLLERLGLAGYERRDIENLSSGEKQRVAIARALLHEPEVLLLDEPTSHLDSDTEAEVESLITGLVRDLDLTAVLVTHDDEQGHRLGDRALKMRDGRVERIGAPHEVIT